LEEIIASIGGLNGIPLKSRRANQSKIEPVQLNAIAISTFPDVLDIVRVFFFVAFLLLLSLPNLV